MSELVDSTITALRANHDTLATLVVAVPEQSLAGASGASDWSIAQVLSHLGSGAEIMVIPLRAAIEGKPLPETDNQTVWARWDAASPEDQAAGFVEHDAVLVETLEALTDEQRANLRVDLGFLPEPVPLETFLGMRLAEVANHAWDVRVGLDPSAGLDPRSAELLARHYAGSLAFLLGPTTRPEVLDEPARVTVDGSDVVAGMVIDGGVSVAGDLEQPTATFRGPLEAAMRLVSGRLEPDHTPAEVDVTGNVSLDQLRRVFPGY
jgi:uncharacterized protein (TIGR03083 family)